MLEALHIENIAVIEKAELEFNDGFNVLTGETGTGKSIIIDALTAVTGGRVSRDLVRSGASSAMISAVFSSSELTENWLTENGIEPDADGKIFIMRRISQDGKNTCRVNGVPLPVALLHELGGLLMDIHGQNDGRKLLDETTHLSYLDNFASISKEKDAYREQFNLLCEKKRVIERLSMDESEKERRIDTLRFQIEELERADVHIGELSDKLARRELLKNSAKLTDALEEAFQALHGNEQEDGAVSLLSEAESALSRAARFSEKLDPLCSNLRNLMYTAQDVSEELSAFCDELNYSPDELETLESRISLLNRLLRKYGGDEKQMLEYLDARKKELEAIEDSSVMLNKLEREYDALLIEAQRSAEMLSNARKEAAKVLESRIKGELSHLNMANVMFKVEFMPVGGEDGLDCSGCDNVCFLMSANAGEKPGRISRIASGGELSRVMLAMKNVLSENDSVGTMVFDEIDTGVSGIAAQRVGEKLAQLSVSRQVMCVTHLPQIAVMADAHFEVRKEESNGRTYTYVNQLDASGRERELARLTGGENITQTTLKSAKEQLAAAEAYKVMQMKKGEIIQ